MRLFKSFGHHQSRGILHLLQALAQRTETVSFSGVNKLWCAGIIRPSLLYCVVLLHKFPVKVIFFSVDY